MAAWARAPRAQIAVEGGGPQGRPGAPQLAEALRVPLRCALLLCAFISAACSVGIVDDMTDLPRSDDALAGDAARSGSDGPAPIAGDGGPTATDGGLSGMDASSDGAAGSFTYVPTPSGCVTDVSAGPHTFTCEGLRVDVTVPVLTSCPASGCGLLIELHGDTGTGLLIDQHTNLRARGAAAGYIVLAPTGPAIGMISGITYPGSTWGPAQDTKLVTIAQKFADVFHVDPKRRHVAGFSRGGYTTWRLACDHSNYFASVAVGGAGIGASMLTSNTPEPTCFEGTHVPARKLDLLVMMGRTDSRYANIVAGRNAALADYGLSAASTTLVAMSTGYYQRRTSTLGAPTVEWFDHAFETDPSGTQAGAKGHCIPGSSVPPNAPQYAVACKPPVGFDWGAEVLTFIAAHPMP